MEQTTTGGKTVTKFFTGFLAPQMLIILLGAAVSVVAFWMKTTANWEKTDKVEQMVTAKADKAETEAKIKALSDQLNRQYERFGKVDDKITILEKQREYDKGYHDGEKDEKKDQRRDKEAAQ